MFFAAFGLTALAAFLVFVSWGILSLLRRPEVAQFVTPDLIRSMPVFFTSATFLAGLLTNFGVLLQSLYLAATWSSCWPRPSRTRAVFVTKLVQAVLPNFLFMCLFNLPALIGLGIAQGYNVTYFVMLPVTLVLLMLAGAGIAAMAVMVVVRLVPARRVAEVLGLVGGVTSILCSQSSQLMRAQRRRRRASSAQDAGAGQHGRAIRYALLAAGMAGTGARRVGRRAMAGSPAARRSVTAALTLGVFAVSLVSRRAIVHLRLGADASRAAASQSRARGTAARRRAP